MVRRVGMGRVIRKGTQLMVQGQTPTRRRRKQDGPSFSFTNLKNKKVNIIQRAT
jgi:single-stranded DNA-binding protein